jgi:hypothetical protein
VTFARTTAAAGEETPMLHSGVPQLYPFRAA